MRWKKDNRFHLAIKAREKINIEHRESKSFDTCGKKHENSYFINYK